MSEKPETAFEQQQASGGVPECALGLLREAAVKLRDCQGERVSKDYGCNTLARIDAFLAAHEPAPVDPLRVMFKEVTGVEISDAELRALRGMGVTVAKGVE